MTAGVFHKSAIEGVMGRLFERSVRFKGPKPGTADQRGAGRGSRARLSRAQQMARAALRRPSAVAKLIRKGGTKDRKGLKGQLEYVFTKSDAVIDSTGRYSDQALLSNADMNRITRTWEATWNSRTQNGNTSHVLVSYPIGTPVEKVRAITADVCNELLSTGDRTFEYVAGIHTDRDHPHAHIIVNRFPNEGGQLFTFRRGTEISYESFKESMVAHGERYGVEMQSTSRFERGLIERPPSTAEVYDARAEGRAPEPRAHDTAFEEYARSAVNDAAGLYSVLGEVAKGAARDPMYGVCVLASEFLRTGTSIAESNRSVVPEAAFEAFAGADQRLAGLGDRLDHLREAIATEDPLERPAHEKQYAKILGAAAMHEPRTEEAKTFQKAAHDATPYGSFLNYNRAALDNPDLPGMVSTSVQGSGIDPDEVLARVSIGADTHYLESQWVIRDLQSVARTHGLDLKAEYSEVAHKLQDIYAELRADFIEIGALAEDHDVYNTAVRDTVAERTSVMESAEQREPFDTPTAQEEARQSIEGAIVDLLERHRKGRVAVSDGVRSEAAGAIKQSLKQGDYADVLKGKINVMQRFTNDRTEQLFLTTVVLKNEIEENGRRDLAPTHAKLKNEHRREVKGHDNDYGW